jgi:hypothetical protein
MLQTQYIASLERANEKIPVSLRNTSNTQSPQGAYPMRPNATTQTCGVSSVGRRDALLGPGMYEVNGMGGEFAADFRDIQAAVRVRDGEFLIGVGGAEDGLWMAVSADATSLDPGLMQEWRERLGEIFGEMEREERGRAVL